MPATAADFKTATDAGLPLDLFVEPPAPCRYSLTEDWMKLYSIGPDQTDNHGDGKDDLMLFQVPVKFLKK